MRATASGRWPSGAQRAALAGSVALSAVLALVGVGLLGPLPVAVMTGVLVAGALGLAALWVAFARFELFLLLLFALRPLLDLFKLDQLGPFTPSVAAGGLFLVAATWWLLARWRAGQWVPLSWASKAMLALPVADVIATITSVAPVTSVITTSRLATGVLMFVVLEQAIGSGELSHRRLMRAVLVSLGVVLAVCLLQQTTGWRLNVAPDADLSRLSGPFVHPSVLAKYLLVILLWLVATRLRVLKRSEWRWYALTVVVVLGLGLTMTRAAWGAALVGVLVIIARRDWRWVPAVLAGVVATALFVPAISTRIASLWTSTSPAPGVPANSFAWRMDYWEQLLPLARTSPLNGVGPGSISLLGTDGLEAHNSWVQVYVETGIVGVAALLLAIAGIVLSLWRASRAVRGAAAGPDAAGLVDAALAVAISLFILLQTENLLMETTSLWYAAAVMVPALLIAGRAGSGPARGPRSASAQSPSAQGLA